MWHTHSHMCTQKNRVELQAMKWIVNILTRQFLILLITAISLQVTVLHEVNTKCLLSIYSDVSLSKIALSVYRFVWYRRLLTDVCWFEVMVNVPVKSAALCLIVRAHASVMGRWEAHEACVCSGKLLNCFCVYTKDHATENIILSSHLCAQRIWTSIDNGVVERRHEWFQKYGQTL